MEGFTERRLPGGGSLFEGELPVELRPSARGFEALWALHPDDYHEILMRGRRVKTPRWQQAYGIDYRYTGSRNDARPVPALLEPYLVYARQLVDARMNGLLLNWYDAKLGHYIGAHRDSNQDRVEGSAIVTISLGATRTFRLRRYRANEQLDLDATDGLVLVMPWDTNLRWTHEVLRRASDEGRRISITARAFVSGATAATGP